MTTDDLRTRAREAAEEWVEDAPWHDIDSEQYPEFIAGFLAHAAQQPTREQIARAIGDAANPTQVGFGVVGTNAAAEAVLALLNGGHS